MTQARRPAIGEALKPHDVVLVLGGPMHIYTVDGHGQTAAAHRLCSSLRPHLKRHYLRPNIGHYGVFSGSKWERQAYPQVRNMVLAMS